MLASRTVTTADESQMRILPGIFPRFFAAFLCILEFGALVCEKEKISSQWMSNIISNKIYGYLCVRVNFITFVNFCSMVDVSLSHACVLGIFFSFPNILSFSFIISFSSPFYFYNSLTQLTNQCRYIFTNFRVRTQNSFFSFFFFNQSLYKVLLFF